MLRRTPHRLRCAAVLLCLAGGLQGAALPDPLPPADTATDTMAQRMQACVVCHGREGRATNAGYFPRIAGKPEGYLYQQLRHFKTGLRRNAPMQHLLRHLSDEDLRAIARHFARLDLPYPPARAAALSPQQAALARTLVFSGAPQRQIPACVACHGQAMAGQLPAMPGLLTLPADYLLAQFGAWRTGQRQATAPDCMAEVARRLQPDEISALAQWLSAQTLPTGTVPAPARLDPLPLPCGKEAP